MRHTLSILAYVAAVVWLCSAMALAQETRRQENDENLERAKLREQAARARQRSVGGLANQLRPFYRYELMHARTACGLTKEQFQKIRPEADSAYEKAIAGLYVAVVRARETPGRAEPDYHEAIRTAVSSVVTRHVGREQWAALQADRLRREASRKEAGVPLLVAIIDRQLLLTGRQRRQIADSLSAHWDDRWCDALEATFTMGTRWPDVPDPLVTPFLSSTQLETWRQVPRIRGLLWGVVIDHGGDPATEQELGAVGDTGPLASRPRRGDAPAAAPFARQPRPAPPVPAVQDLAVRRDVIVRPAQIVVGGDARLPAAAVRPGVVQDVGEDPAEEEGAAERLQRQQLERQKLLEERYLSLFDRQIFGNMEGEDSTRLQFESALTKRVDELGRDGNLTDTQRKKLRAAGNGDIKRFFDRVAEARETFRGRLFQAGRVRLVLDDVAPLRTDRAALLKVEGPVFTRVLSRTLTDDDHNTMDEAVRDRLAFRHRADVGWTAVLLARSLGLVDDQRRRLESLLLDRAVPPRRFDAHDYLDYAIVMYQAARIPEKDMRPIFDDLQWRVLRQEFAAARQWDLYLRRGGFFEKKYYDTRESPLPPIHLLDPPTIRSR